MLIVHVDAFLIDSVIEGDETHIPMKRIVFAHGERTLNINK